MALCTSLSVMCVPFLHFRKSKLTSYERQGTHSSTAGRECQVSCSDPTGVRLLYNVSLQLYRHLVVEEVYCPQATVVYIIVQYIQ